MEIKFPRKIQGVKGVKPGLYEARYMGFEEVKDKVYGSEIGETEDKIYLNFELVTAGTPTLPYKLRPYISQGAKPSKLWTLMTTILEEPTSVQMTEDVYGVFNEMLFRTYMVQVGVSPSGWNRIESVSLAPGQDRISSFTRTDDVPSFDDYSVEVEDA